MSPHIQAFQNYFEFFAVSFLTTDKYFCIIKSYECLYILRIMRAITMNRRYSKKDNQEIRNEMQYIERENHTWKRCSMS